MSQTDGIDRIRGEFERAFRLHEQGKLREAFLRYDAILKAFYLKLRAAGKPPKVALVACMRKLVVLMNRLLRNPKFQLAN